MLHFAKCHFSLVISLKMKLAPLDHSSAKKFRAYKILVEHFHQNINQWLLLTLRDAAKWPISRSSSRQTVFLGKLLHISTSWQTQQQHIERVSAVTDNTDNHFCHLIVYHVHCCHPFNNFRYSKFAVCVSLVTVNKHDLQETQGNKKQRAEEKDSQHSRKQHYPLPPEQQHG